MGTTGYGTGHAPKIGNVDKGTLEADDNYSGTWGGTQKKWGAESQQALEDAYTGTTSVAQQQLQAGMGAAQQSMAAQAQARGSNPLAQRAALQAGGQMQAGAANASAQLRAQEILGAQQMRADYFNQQAQGHMGFEQMKLDREIAQAEMEQRHREYLSAEEERDRQFGSQIAGQVMGGIATAAMLSDEECKRISAEYGIPIEQVDASLGGSYHPKARELRGQNYDYEAMLGPGTVTSHGEYVQRGESPTVFRTARGWDQRWERPGPVVIKPRDMGGTPYKDPGERRDYVMDTLAAENADEYSKVLNRYAADRRERIRPIRDSSGKSIIDSETRGEKLEQEMISQADADMRGPMAKKESRPEPWSSYGKGEILSKSRLRGLIDRPPSTHGEEPRPYPQSGGLSDEKSKKDILELAGENRMLRMANSVLQDRAAGGSIGGSIKGKSAGTEKSLVNSRAAQAGYLAGSDADAVMGRGGPYKISESAKRASRIADEVRGGYSDDPNDWTYKGSAVGYNPVGGMEFRRAVNDVWDEQGPEAAEKFMEEFRQLPPLKQRSMVPNAAFREQFRRNEEAGRDWWIPYKYEYGPDFEDQPDPTMMEGSGFPNKFPDETSRIPNKNYSVEKFMLGQQAGYVPQSHRAYEEYLDTAETGYGPMPADYKLYPERYKQPEYRDPMDEVDFLARGMRFQREEAENAANPSTGAVGASAIVEDPDFGEKRRRYKEFRDKEGWLSPKTFSLSDENSKRIVGEQAATIKALESALLESDGGYRTLSEQIAYQHPAEKAMMADASALRGAGKPVLMDRQQRMEAASNWVQENPHEANKLIQGTPLIEYEYNDRAQRDMGMPPGRRMGTGARALNRAGPIGAGITEQTPNGMMTIKPDEGVGAALGMGAVAGRKNLEQDAELEALKQRLHEIERSNY